MSEIYILSGSVGTGKTTALMKWLAGKNAAGLITVTIDETRFLYSLIDRTVYPFEAGSNTNEEVIEVGRYKFYKSAFDKADELIKQTDFKKYEYFVLDESGPLEMRGTGFYNSILWLLDEEKNMDIKIIFVVRTHLIAPFAEKFSLNETKILTIQDLEAGR